MTKDPYSASEHLLEQLYSLLEKHAGELPALKKQLQEPIDKAYFSIASIRGGLPHVKNPQDGYVLLPKNLEIIHHSLSTALPTIADAAIQETLADLAGKIPALLLELPQPMEEAFSRLNHFLTTTESLSELRAKLCPSIEKILEIIHAGDSDEGDVEHHELIDLLEQVGAEINRQIPVVNSKSTANTLSCLAKIVTHFQSEVHLLNSAICAM